VNIADVPSIPGIGRLVVYTCITGGYDIPLESPWALRCPHLCFTDAPRLRSATWTHVPLQDGEDLDLVRRARRPKLLPHRYLEDFDVSIWIDASAGLLVDPVELARSSLGDASIAIPRHPARDCVYREIDTCVALRKDAESTLRAQGRTYRDAGLPERNGLWEATIIVRRHHDPHVVEAMEAWWDELQRGSRRDQVSLPWIVWKTGLRIHPLPVRSLPEQPAPAPVYRMGSHHHRRKPLRRAAIQAMEGLRRCRTRLLRFFSGAAQADLR
jgi:hypothetical protein